MLLVLHAFGLCGLRKDLFVQFIADAVGFGHFQNGIAYLCSLDEHLFAALLLDLVALWLLGQT